MPMISDEEYSILKAASAVKLGLDAHVAEQEMIQQQQIAAIKAGVGSFFKRTVMWFFIILGSIIAIIILASAL
jgi:hypothetical protein